MEFHRPRKKTRSSILNEWLVGYDIGLHKSIALRTAVFPLYQLRSQNRFPSNCNEKWLIDNRQNLKSAQGNIEKAQEHNAKKQFI